jgi:hypothetical protein
MKIETHHSLMKYLLEIALLMPFFNFPALAQIYTHEFVNPDGSSYMCSSTISGSSSQSGCAKVPIDERIKHQEKLLQRADQGATCSEKATLHAKTYGYSAYFAQYLKCMGHCRPGSTYESMCPR